MESKVRNLCCVGSHNFNIYRNFVADSYTTFLWFSIRLILVKLKYLESRIKLLDDICKVGIQALLTLFMQILELFNVYCKTKI